MDFTTRSKTMREWLARFIVIMIGVPAFAAEHTDGQIRAFLHVQRGEARGVAAWLILPDPTHRPNGVYGEAGYLIRDRRVDRVRWAEFLVGTYVSSEGDVEPALHVRLSHRRVSTYGASAAAFYNLQSSAVAVQLQLAFDLPLRGWQLGLDTEIQHEDGSTIPSIGPRIAYSPMKHVSLALAFQVRPNRQDIFRSYSGVHY